MITLTDARNILDASLSEARARNCPPMTVAVMNAAGQLVAFASEDGSSLLRERIARAKALGALNMGMGSRALARRASEHPHFINAVTALADGNLVPVPGGVIVRDDRDVVMGAVGVSGHHPDADEACAIAGIRAVGLQEDPGE
jgi:uncharacterized protein GlcG (DUF336 family)